MSISAVLPIVASIGGALKDAVSGGVSLVGKGIDTMGDVLTDVSENDSSIQNPMSPVINAAGKTLNLIGGLGTVISDEDEKNIYDESQNILQQLFEEYIQSPEFIQSLTPYKQELIISDFNKKILKGYANQKEPLSKQDIAIISYIMGKGNGNLDPMESGEWTDDMVQEYADNLRNFLYTYKESATEIDPSIDPEEYHRGPMAQDIEKVAPDCVHETNSGVKVVDGNRLALVNAGVIGDLARRLIELEDSVYGNK